MSMKIHYFDILTIFPSMIDSYANESILGRAQKAKLIKIVAHDLRAFTKDKHHKVDDTPYGGGPGMVMKVEPFAEGLKSLKGWKPACRSGRGLKGKKTRVILTAANGKTFTQADAKRLAKYEQVIFLCGRYEGIDQRVEDHLVDETFSIGNYVLTGGELPALVMTDAIARNIKGVLGKEASLEKESHTQDGYLEYPQYTKPEIYRYSPLNKGGVRGGSVKKGKGKIGYPLLGKEGVRGRSESWNVPDILLSGDHKKIDEWREEQSKKKRGN